MAEETIGKAYIQVLPSIKDFKPQLEKEIQTDLSSAGTSAGNSFGDSLKSAIKAAGIIYAVKEVAEGVASIVKQSIGNYAEFETATAKVATIMDTSVMSVAEMQSGIMDLSNQFGISTSELSDTVYNAISATGDTANALEIAENAAKLASAGFTDSSSALSVLTTAMNAYGLSADQASAISDSLIQVQNLGVTTVAELSTVMGKAIASASAYGVDLGNVEAAYVAMTKAGINTAESTTYMSSMMKELGDSGSDVSGILMEMTGKSFPELMSEGASLADVLGILYEAVDGDTTALMNLWGSAEAGKAANAIINQGLDEFNNNLITITGSAGATQSAFETMDDTLESKINKLSTAWTNLLTGMASGQDVTGLAENLVNQFESVADAVMPLIENIADSLPQIFETIGARLPELLGALLPSLIQACVSLLTSLIGNLPTVIQPLISALPSVIDSVLSGLVECLPQLLSGIGSLIGQLISELPAMLGSIVTAIPDILMGLVEGIGGGIAGIIRGVIGNNEWYESLQATYAGIDELMLAQQDLQASIEATRTSYEGAIDATEADAYASELLAAKLFELIDASDGTAASNAEIQAVVDMLNKSVPNLGLAWDAESGSLNMSNGALLQHIELMKLEAQQEAAKQYYINALQAQWDAEQNITYTRERAIELANELGISEQTYLDIVADGIVTEEERNRIHNEVGEGGVVWAKQIGEQLLEINQSELEANEAFENAVANVGFAEENLEAKVDAATEAAVEQAEAIATAADEMATSAETDYGEVADAAESAANTVATESEVMNAAMDSVDASNVVAEVESAQAAADSMDNSGYVAEVDEMQTAQEATDLQSHIKQEISGLITFVSGSIILSTAWKLILNNMTTAMETTSTSLSTEMRNAMANVRTAITSGGESANAAMRSIVSSMTSTANQLSSSMQNAGYMAGAGLYNGLAAWQSSLYSLAWSIASSINAAARAALMIRSPSHLMEETGEFTGKGLAIGIENSEEDVMDAMAGLTDGMISAANGVVTAANTSAASVLGSPVNVEGMVTQSVNGTVLAQMAQSDNGNVMDVLVNIYNAMVQMANMKMVLDTGEVVAALAPAFDREYAVMAEMEARR